jgi:uncharacterized OB-fold protein
MEAPRRIISPVPDRDTGHYWAALAKGSFEVQHCRDCGRWTWPARMICSGCHGENMVWEQPKGTGEIYSWVVTHRATTPDYAALVPYVVALVRLDEQRDILIPGRLLPGVEPRQGLKVRAAPEQVSDTVGRLNWMGLPD